LLELINYPALRQEQAKRRSEPSGRGGKLLGIGIGCYVEICGLGPWEMGSITVDQEGKVTVLSGTSPHGQGHQTAWAQIASGILQIPLEDITVKHGDTFVVPRGVGTFGSRSAPVGGAAVFNNSVTVRNRARDIAAHLLEAASVDIVLSNGRFHVAGSPSKGVTWREVAQAAASGNAPETLQGELTAEEDYQHKGDTYPFGAHACVVELDPETGRVEIIRYVAVDDCGPVINPMLADGQVHGGLAQGIGQALIEGAIYDEIGQLVSGSFMDYAMPRADNFPYFETNRTETPTPHNPMGVKGIGEAATIGSTPTVANAVVDALSHLGVKNVNMPFTAEKIWRIVHGISQDH
jgi:carbon-monoxide dehydrogenase large subunit